MDETRVRSYFVKGCCARGNGDVKQRKHDRKWQGNDEGVRG